MLLRAVCRRVLHRCASAAVVVGSVRCGFGLWSLGAPFPPLIVRPLVCLFIPHVCSTCVQKKKKEKWVPPKMTRVGKRKKGSGPQAAYKLPAALPVSKCKLRLLRLERIKDFLLLEEEFLANQAARKPREQQDEEDKSRVDEIRGSPMSVATIEELIDDNHAIISSTNGPEYYVRKKNEKKGAGHAR